MSRYLFGGTADVPIVTSPSSHVAIHGDGTTAAPAPVIHDWQADEDGPLTQIAIELALTPALTHRVEAVRAAARVCRRHLEALLIQEIQR